MKKNVNHGAVTHLEIARYLANGTFDTVDPDFASAPHNTNQLGACD